MKEMKFSSEEEMRQQEGEASPISVDVNEDLSAKRSGRPSRVNVKNDVHSLNKICPLTVKTQSEIFQSDRVTKEGSVQGLKFGRESHGER